MATITSDTLQVKNLSLERVKSYIQGIGWKRVSHPNQNIILFQRWSISDLEQPVQLVLPSSTRFWDSSILLDKAINLLAASEDRSPEEIRAAIQSENSSDKAVESDALTEEALLQKINELLHLPKRPLTKRSGYDVVTKKNQARVNLKDFYAELLATKSLLVNHDKQSNGRTRQLTYRVSVDKRGQITICASYTQAIGLKPGDEFEVKLGFKQITLFRIENSGDKQTVN